MNKIIYGSNKVHNIDIKRYIDVLFNILHEFNVSSGLNFEITNPDNNYNHSFTGNILYLEYINENTFNNIDIFIKNKFPLYHYNNLIQSIKENIFNQKKYAIFIFIKSYINAIPFIIDDCDLYLKITYNNKTIFNTIDYL